MREIGHTPLILGLFVLHEKLVILLLIGTMASNSAVAALRGWCENRLDGAHFQGFGVAL